MVAVERGFKIRPYEEEDYEQVSQMLQIFLFGNRNPSVYWRSLDGSGNMTAWFWRILFFSFNFRIFSQSWALVVAVQLLFEWIIYEAIRYDNGIWFYEEHVRKELEDDTTLPRLNNEHNSLYVAQSTADSTLLGVIALTRNSEQEVEMKRVFVSEYARGLGIGKALVQKVLDEAQSRGYQQVIARTSEGRHAAIKMYKSFGFELVQASWASSWTLLTAERRQSLGFDWHPWCLKCEECGKVLNPGQHAEHKSKPYCHIPCYSALFGPKLFGHGSTVESHQSFGQRSVSFIREQSSLQKSIKAYNTYFEGKKDDAKMGITYREVNGRLVLEGILKVFWGVTHSIRLREFDDKRPISQKKKAIEERQKKCLSLGYHYEQDQELRYASGDSDNEENEVSHEKSVIGVKPQACGTESERISDKRNDPKYKSLPWRSKKNAEKMKFRDDTNVNGRNVFSRQNSSEKTFPTTKLELLQHYIHPTSNLNRVQPTQDIPQDLEAKTTLEKLHQEWKENNITSDKDIMEEKSEKVCEDKIVRGKGPRALRRRHGKKMERSKLKRRSSINGHWVSDEILKSEPSSAEDLLIFVLRYDRDTSVFTPPKGSSMSIYTSSLLKTNEILKLILEKYQIESDLKDFALYVVKETGERRLVKDHEYPLLLRVNLGPHEEISKLYLMDQNQTTEIRQEVAQYIKFSYTECRAFVNMFYEEEEQEVEKIREKYKLMRKRLNERMFELRVKF